LDRNDDKLTAQKSDRSLMAKMNTVIEPTENAKTKNTEYQTNEILARPERRRSKTPTNMK
jgi:hypothetical protein